MLVLGYAKATNADVPTLEVTPFHTGHLGFVPDTPVRVGLVNESPEVPHREVVVTPFKKDTRDLALVTVAMRDRAGVVARLVSAVAALGFNIEVLESSSIKQLHNHSVTLLVQLSKPLGGLSVEDETPTAIQRVYQGYDSIFPVENFACVCLFESIVAHCADIIEWKPPTGETRFPDIEIRRYPDRRTQSDFVVQPLVPAPGKNLHVHIDLPNEIANGLRSVVSDGRLEYLLVSDTTTRALHAFFMQPELASRVFHVGFFHDDVPGALATILALLREAEFNILTSLVRKQQEGRSVWEAVLQYQGEAEVPNGDSRQAHEPVTQAEIGWICERIVAAHETIGREVVDCAIDVAPPRYPVRKGDEAVDPVSLSSLLGGGAERGTVPRYEPVELLSEQLASLDANGADSPDGEAAKRLVRLIQRRYAEHGRPAIFLSYPRNAHELGEAVWERLGGPWRMVRYQKPDGEVILEQVKAKVEECDYFIGIWHYEGAAPAEGRTKEISPWMFFEYGLAHAAGKPAMIVHSDKLAKEIWQRISPDVASPEYSEARFTEETVDLILDYAERHFV